MKIVVVESTVLPKAAVYLLDDESNQAAAFVVGIVAAVIAVVSVVLLVVFVVVAFRVLVVVVGVDVVVDLVGLLAKSSYSDEFHD